MDDWVKILKGRFRPPAWVILSQVRNGTGAKVRPRTADAIAFSTWPSMGLEVHGLEFKRYKGDLIRELEDPDKSEEISKYCDRWSLVVHDIKTIDGVELPPAWGVILLDEENSRTKKVKEAAKTEALPLDRIFVASIARSLADQIGPGDLDRAYQEGFRAGQRVGFENGVDIAGKTGPRKAENWDKLVLALGEKDFVYPQDLIEDIVFCRKHKVRYALEHLRSVAASVLRELQE